MKKLTLAFALLLTASAAAHAQVPGGGPGSDPRREAMRLGDAAKAEEAHISDYRASNVRIENEAAAARRHTPRTFKAEVEVTNHSAKAIKSVAWTAMLVDTATGDVIRTYDVETKSRIAPGKTKKLAKRLPTPRARVVNASGNPSRRAAVANLKVEVASVTYADGTTSTAP
ncbi:MAG: hypothetical protein ABW208_00280 [Pyrinomonadaceae bacterium]